MSDSQDNKTPLPEAIFAALETSPSLCVWYDADDRLRWMNRAFTEHYRQYAHIVRYGRRFDEMLNEIDLLRPIPESSIDPDWLKKRMEYRKNPSGTILRPMLNGAWYRLTEWRTPDGGIMSIFAAAPESSEQSQLHNSLMSNMRDIVFCRSERGVDAVKVVGASAESFLGISEGGEPHSPEYWYGLVHPDDRARYIDAERDRKAKGIPYAIEYRFRHPKTGVWRWAREVAWTSEDPALGKVYFDSYVVDRSDAKEQEAASHQLREVLDAATDIIAIFNPDGSLRYLNSGARRDFGIPQSTDIEGVRITNYMPASVRHMLLHDAMHQARMRGSWMGELVFRTVNQSALPCSAVLVAHHNTGGQIDRFSLIARDISDQRESEYQLRVMRDRAEEANRAKSRFLATMSHELRTPLNAIIGFSELMGEELFGPLGAPRYREYLKDIRSSATHLLSLIGDVLDVSRIEAGKVQLDPEPIDVGTLVYQITDMISSRIYQKKLDLKVSLAEDCPPLNADKQAFRQCLLNLLSNAIKFTPDGGAILVEVDPADPEGYRVSVTDSGRGIPEDQLEKVLEPFSQVEEDIERRKHEGSGLGLSIVNSLMGLHGGRLQVTNADGAGAMVSLIFPRRPAQR
jgi:signal transduction histidine kinase